MDRLITGMTWMLLLVAALSLSGCEAAGWLAQGLEGSAPPIQVEAEYQGLQNQRVAVLVDAKLDTMYRHPLAQLEVAKVVSDRIAANVPGATVLNPRQVVDFQQRNIYWNTSTYSELAKRLDVSRLVMIDLSEYRLHEPGNVHMWRGQIAASVGVAETDSDKPDDLAYATVVNVAYPPDKPMGAIKADERTIKLGMYDLFGRAVVGKFHDHERPRSGE